MIYVVGLTGKAGAGKDTVADWMVENKGFTKISFAAPIKRALVAMIPELTWEHFEDRERKEMPLKTIPSTPRRLAQTLGTEWGRDIVSPHLWVHLAAQEAEGKERVVFSDVRFPNEVDMIRNYLGGFIWAVDRGIGYGEVAPHISESYDLVPDSCIGNFGSEESLYRAVQWFSDELLLR